MSETQDETTTVNEAQSATPATDSVKLDGLFAFKVGMSSVYDDEGKATPVTVLKYEPMVISQLKTEEREGYKAVQVACKPKRAVRTSKAERGHLKAAGFENGAYVIRELSMGAAEGLEVGQKIDINSLVKGDVVTMTAKSKGRGFAGTMKRWDFGGGPASHGSGFHRKPGSIGNRTWPGKVLAGKRMAGHFGDEVITVKNVKIVDVIAEDNVLLVKGPVPGGRNSLVRLSKV